jgi:hypothetical protein
MYYDLVEVGCRLLSFKSRMIEFRVRKILILLLKKDQGLIQMIHVLLSLCHTLSACSVLAVTLLEEDK